MRAKASEFDVDQGRIGLIGHFAGAHLSALVALAGDQFTSAYRDDAHVAVPANVKAVVGFYGVYDLLGQWTHDQAARPRDPIVEKILGTSPMVNRRIYSRRRRSATRPSIAISCASCLFMAPTTTLSLGNPIGRFSHRARPGPILRPPDRLARRRAFLVR